MLVYFLTVLNIAKGTEFLSQDPSLYCLFFNIAATKFLTPYLSFIPCILYTLNIPFSKLRFEPINWANQSRQPLVVRWSWLHPTIYMLATHVHLICTMYVVEINISKNIYINISRGFHGNARNQVILWVQKNDIVASYSVARR